MTATSDPPIPAPARIQEDRFGNKFILRGTPYATWERGLEYIQQEGSDAWQAIRERLGLSVEDMESISSGDVHGARYSTAGYVFWEEISLAENHPGIPKLEHICLLAWLTGMSPGALLDRVLIEKGRELEEDERRT